MRTRKNRYHELTENKEYKLEPLKAKRGAKRMRDEAVELHDLLRTYTGRMISLGNAFRRIAADFSSLDGSNWRHNRHVNPNVSALAEMLYRMDPNDIDAILKIEDVLEDMARKASIEGGSK